MHVCIGNSVFATTRLLFNWPLQELEAVLRQQNKLCGDKTTCLLLRLFFFFSFCNKHLQLQRSRLQDLMPSVAFASVKLQKLRLQKRRVVCRCKVDFVATKLPPVFEAAKTKMSLQSKCWQDFDTEKESLYFYCLSLLHRALTCTIGSLTRICYLFVCVYPRKKGWGEGIFDGSRKDSKNKGTLLQ